MQPTGNFRSAGKERGLYPLETSFVRSLQNRRFPLQAGGFSLPEMKTGAACAGASPFSQNPARALAVLLKDVQIALREGDGDAFLIEGQLHLLGQIEEKAPVVGGVHPDPGGDVY